MVFVVKVHLKWNRPFPRYNCRWVGYEKTAKKWDAILLCKNAQFSFLSRNSGIFLIFHNFCIHEGIGLQSLCFLKWIHRLKAILPTEKHWQNNDCYHITTCVFIFIFPPTCMLARNLDISSPALVLSCEGVLSIIIFFIKLSINLDKAQSFKFCARGDVTRGNFSRNLQCNKLQEKLRM